MTEKYTSDMQAELEVLTTKEARYGFMSAIQKIQGGTPGQIIGSRKLQGKNMPFISGDAVIYLLNNIFSYQWSFRLLETRVIEGQDRIDKDTGQITPQPSVIQSLGQLTIPGMGIREQWGSAVLTGGSDVQQSAFKSASTDALKKCASMFGIGLDVSNKYNTFYKNLSVTDKDLVAKEIERVKMNQWKTGIEEKYGVKKTTEKEVGVNVQQEETPIVGVQTIPLTEENLAQQTNKAQTTSVVLQETTGNYDWPTQPTSQPTIEPTTPPVVEETPKRTLEETTMVPKKTVEMQITPEETMELKKLMIEKGITTIEMLIPYIQVATKNNEATFNDLTSQNLESVLLAIMKGL